MTPSLSLSTALLTPLPSSEPSDVGPSSISADSSLVRVSLFTWALDELRILTDGQRRTQQVGDQLLLICEFLHVSVTEGLPHLEYRTHMRNRSNPTMPCASHHWTTWSWPAGLVLFSPMIPRRLGLHFLSVGHKERCSVIGGSHMYGVFIYLLCHMRASLN